MTVRVNKSSFNIREKLSELGRKFGLKGSELVAAETVQEARELVSVGRKNKVINGAMQFSQRKTSESGISSSNTVRVLDRFQVRINSTGTWTVSQSTESPPGFANSMRWQCTTADASPGASDFMYMAHRFEGLNVQDLAKGTSSAKPVTVSFWVRSTVTGSYSFRLVDNQNSRQIGQNYTVNQADTWEHKTMTFAGDMTGALTNDTTNRLSMMWWLGVGSDRTSGDIPTSWETLTTADEAAGQTANIASSTSNNFYITGIQLEVGRNATEFEHRSYGEELALCQRYFYGWNATSSTERAKTGIKVYDFEGNSSVNQTTTIGTGSVVDADDARIEFSFPVAMRTKPTATASDLRLAVGSTLYNTTTTVQYNNSTIHHFSALVDNGGNMTAGQAAILIIKGNGYFYLDAEY